MRIMAIDYGDARTGVAVSDLSASVVGDTWVIQSRNDNHTSRSIIDEAIKRDVKCIVVGFPKNMDGTVGARAEKSGQFAELLRSLLSQQDTQVVLWDERLTTKSANRILTETGTFGKKRKNTVDAVAAALILEGYMLAHSHKL